MSMWHLAYQNFKASLKNYIALILSMAFTILIFYNFQNMIDSEVLSQLGVTNARNVEVILEVLTFVLGCFMVFFIWYATNVFLEKRKMEIGIYIFMGLNNQKIGKLYMIEVMLTGLISMILGTLFGVLTSQLFQMILLKLSDIAVDFIVTFSLQSVWMTMLVYGIIYSIFALKGYLSILRSSVLDMVSATRRNEYVQKRSGFLYVKAAVGCVVLGLGYYLAIAKGGMEVLTNALAAVVLVTAGVYLLFGGLISVIFQSLAKRKRFLYHQERVLWINNIIFRMKKNYRTYAIVTVLMLCSVTALASGFAMKNRHDSILHFRNTYTYQVMSPQPDLFEEYTKTVEQRNEIAYRSRASILFIDSKLLDTRYASSAYAILAYSDIQRLAESANLTFDLKEPKDDEYLDIDKLLLINLITDRSNETININGKEYHNAGGTNTAYLGYLQEKSEFYLVNDAQYARLRPLGQEVHTYNYKLTDLTHFTETSQDLLANVNTQGLVKIENAGVETEWIKILFSVCVFLFMVFILASASIIFMKLYNDAFDDHHRYIVLQKLGVRKRTLQKAVAYEVLTSYLIPFIVMTISSYFSVRAIGNVMQTDLLTINIVSVLLIGIFFILCYFFSVSMYMKNAKIKG